MKQQTRKLFLLFLMTAVMPMGQRSALSATDGSSGATSTGTAVITLVIPEVYMISRMPNFSLGTYSGSGDMTANNDLCVYSNGNGAYRTVIIDSTPLSPAGFAVQDTTNTKQIPMQVYWNNHTGITGNSAVSYNTPLSMTGANTQSSTCAAGGLSANMQIRFSQANLQAALAGDYSSTLTVLIEP
jgi:hypothetical protein